MIMEILLIIGYPIFVQSACPFLDHGTPSSNYDPSIPELDQYNEALYNLDINAVFKDIDDLLTDSQECWPADTFNGYSNYGPLFIRLAWHCSGTYRNTDGVGGCAGGRQRFAPEASWEDNVNLDKARALVAPIKEKYGDALSWGDLFVFAGTASILNMNGPINEICAGRVDDVDGENSEILDEPCDDQGNCGEPYGTSTVGLIYVNPEGVLGKPDPKPSAERIREIFGRMDMNDRETVALIGGGHEFGKAHGACPDGHGPGPDEDPYNPWPGNCGTGMGEDTFTSGLEGQWTTYPLKWDNEYFTQLVDDNYTLIKGAGDKYQWINDRNGNMMFTTDLALIYDEDYKKIVEEYANDIHALDTAFAGAWEKLTTNGGRWVQNKKCINAKDLDYNDHAPSDGHQGPDYVPSDDQEPDYVASNGDAKDSFGFWEWLTGEQNRNNYPGEQDKNEDYSDEDKTAQEYDEKNIGDYNGKPTIKYGRWDNTNDKEEYDEEHQPQAANYGHSYKNSGNKYGQDRDDYDRNNYGRNWDRNYDPYYPHDSTEKGGYGRGYQRRDDYNQGWDNYKRPRYEPEYEPYNQGWNNYNNGPDRRYDNQGYQSNYGNWNNQGGSSSSSRVCRLPPVTGYCRARKERWYYNKRTNKCETFYYGGCGGNGNNFGSLGECKRYCY